MEERKRFPEMVSKDPWDYVQVALALEILAFHNKNYLDRIVCDDAVRSREIQDLLTEALAKAHE